MKTNVIVSTFIFIALGSSYAESFDNLERALAKPQSATSLSIKEDSKLKHLPSKLGSLINLKELEISCLENLEELPVEIGQLKKLEKLIIDNGNGCQMSISIPASIGELSNLKVLRLVGALGPRESEPGVPVAGSETKKLPATIAKLQNLQELDLGRNSLKSVPAEIASLKKLEKLGLDYNNIHEIPASFGELSNLKKLSVASNEVLKLPESLSKIPALEIVMGNNHLTLKEQDDLRRRFPKATFNFENEYDDGAANEEPRN